MLQVARLAPRLLGDSTPLVLECLRAGFTSDGGAVDRAGNVDLYYTVFALEGLLALRADLPADAAQRYLLGFGAGDSLDFVHLACLARAWASLPESHRAGRPTAELAANLAKFRTPCGGYAAEAGATEPTLYGAFLAVGAFQDLGLPVLDAAGILASIDALKCDDGGYANQRDVPTGLTPSTAAAVALKRQLGAPLEPGLAEWLLARHSPDGGFFATPLAPMPDLLSTATALHALSSLHANFDAVREPCLDFLDTLWSSRGGFHGHWADDHLDCEYTYYALLALGHLSV